MIHVVSFYSFSVLFLLCSLFLSCFLSEILNSLILSSCLLFVVGCLLFVSIVFSLVPLLSFLSTLCPSVPPTTNHTSERTITLQKDLKEAISWLRSEGTPLHARPRRRPLRPRRRRTRLCRPAPTIP